MEKWLDKFIFILVVIFLASIFWPRGYDDTDDKVNEVRSGMELFIDHGTGCHYLATLGFLSYTNLIPRLDSDGNHVCKGEGK